MSKYEKWQRTRAKGRAHFIWFNGFLVWGFTTAITWSVIMSFISPVDPWWLRFAIALAAFPLGGLGWAAYVWKKSEARYQQWQQELDGEESVR